MNINTSIEPKALAMSGTQAKKLELLEWLAALQDKSLIDELAQWKEARLSDSTNKAESEQDKTAVGYKADGTPITKSDLIDRAKASNEDIKAGRTKSIHQLRKEIKDW